MTSVHVIAIQGELLRLRAEIKQLLAAYLLLTKKNAPLDKRKQLRSQIRMLMHRGRKLKFNLPGRNTVNDWLYEMVG